MNHETNEIHEWQFPVNTGNDKCQILSTLRPPFSYVESSYTGDRLIQSAFKAVNLQFACMHFASGSDKRTAILQ